MRQCKSLAIQLAKLACQIAKRLIRASRAAVILIGIFSKAKVVVACHCHWNSNAIVDAVVVVANFELHLKFDLEIAQIYNVRMATTTVNFPLLRLFALIFAWTTCNNSDNIFLSFPDFPSKTKPTICKQATELTKQLLKKIHSFIQTNTRLLSFQWNYLEQEFSFILSKLRLLSHWNHYQWEISSLPCLAVHICNVHEMRIESWASFVISIGITHCVIFTNCWPIVKLRLANTMGSHNI